MNPRRLVALTVMAMMAAGCSSTPPADEAAAETSSTSMSTPSGAEASASEVPDGEHEDVEAPAIPAWSTGAEGDVLARAEGFVRAWARPDLGATQWFAGLQGYLSPAAAEGFMWTDPSLVPATAVTGPSRLAGDGSPTSATVAVPTDAGEMHVLLIHTDDQTPWQVSSVTPADEQEAP